MRKRSLLGQITVSASLGVLLFLGIWTAGVVLWMYSGSLVGLEREADRQAREISLALDSLVWNLDESAIYGYLDAKTEGGEIVQILVTEQPGRRAWMSPRTPPGKTSVPTVVRSVAVNHQGVTLATVAVTLSLGPRNTEMARSVGSLVISQILLFLSVLAAVTLSWQSVRRRLREMVRILETFNGNETALRMPPGREDELGILARGFNTMADRIQATTQSMDLEIRQRTERLMDSEKLALVGRLSAHVAHEVNTPVGNGITITSWLTSRTKELNGLRAEGRLAEQELSSYLADVESSLAILQSGLGRTSDLIQALKKNGADQVVDERRTLLLHDFLGEVLSSVRPTLKHFPHRVDLICPQGLAIEGHPGALFQIVTNLILNAHNHAFRADEEGVITLEVQADPQDSPDFRIIVRDDGAGMSDEVRARIFEPFFTTRRGQGGTGLGLSIVESLVQHLGGTIGVQTFPGKGTTFTITLPRRAPDDPSPGFG